MLVTVVNSRVPQYLMRRVNRRQPTNQMNTIIITNELNGNMKEEEERKSHNIVYPVRSNNDLLWGKEKLSFPLIKRVTLHKDSKRNYKNQSSNIILPFS